MKGSKKTRHITPFFLPSSLLLFLSISPSPPSALPSDSSPSHNITIPIPTTKATPPIPTPNNLLTSTIPALPPVGTVGG